MTLLHGMVVDHLLEEDMVEDFLLQNTTPLVLLLDIALRLDTGRLLDIDLLLDIRNVHLLVIHDQ